jgi:hypothetical protein
MKGIIERAYWWWMLRTSRTIRINGVVFIYISAEANCPRTAIVAALREASKSVSVAGGGFGELVGSHLRLVAAVNSKRGWVAPYVGGYVSSFPPIEVSNPYLLACRLVWAATVIRLSQDAFASKVPRDMAAIRRAAHEAQLRFVRQFPDNSEWVEYLEEDRP